MSKIAFILLISLIAFSCKTQKQASGAVDINEETKLLVSYEQVDENNSGAPEFKIELYSNRQMYLTANKNLDKVGKYMRTVSEKEFKQINKRFSETNFFAYNNEYKTNQTNLPSKYLYYAFEGKQKKILHISGAPETLIELEYLMQSFLDRVGWEKLVW